MSLKAYGMTAIVEVVLRESYDQMNVVSATVRTITDRR